ncbi:protein NipSnap-like [Ylistrum balloti]|uniref:protein NipSnap-like n=1 Tax=Ylistrum balloti TaxID=509963 RepID=UPI002905ED8E|nr:protein NipSnap-like [Ylistrum balloti]
MELTKMAGTVARQLFSRNSALSCRVLNFGQVHHSRCLSTSHTLQTDSDSNSKGWLKNILPVRTLPASKESHSSLLSNKETVYEMQFHAVKPENMEEYLKQFQSFQQLMHDKGTGAKLIGSFTVEIGDQDEAIHIWQYPGGYPVLNKATEIYRKDKDFIDYRLRRNKMLRSRKNQILLPFSFWPEPTARSGSNIYEMRSYTLKPGTMIEWGNNWARGIKSRADEPVCGLFSQMGELNTVQHIWGYTDLQTRKDTREQAWSKPGWDECVAYTVPLIRHMQSRILIPTPFSPLQ